MLLKKLGNSNAAARIRVVSSARRTNSDKHRKERPPPSVAAAFAFRAPFANSEPHGSYPQIGPKRRDPNNAIPLENGRAFAYMDLCSQ